MNIERELGLFADFFVPRRRASGKIYYVDATGGSDSNDGLSTGAAWKTLAKVSGFTFGSGDSILLKKGEVWRETVTLPGGVKVNSYGTGADPKISGADLVSGSWATVPQALASYTTKTFNSINIKNTTSQQKQSNEWVPASNCTISSVKLWLYQAGTISSGNIYIEIYNDSSGSPGSLITNGTSNTITASTITTNTAGAEYEFTFSTPPSLTGGQTYYIAVTGSYSTSSSNYIKSYGGTVGAPFPERWRWTPWAGLTDYSLYMVVTGTSATPTLWSIGSITTEPKVVLFDGISGNKKTSTSAVTATSDWYWAANTLYVYSTSDPSSAFTTVEAGKRDTCITTNGSNISVAGIDAQGSNLYNVLISGDCSNLTFDACKFTDAYEFGLLHSSADDCTNVTITNCYSARNGAGGILVAGQTASNTSNWLIRSHTSENDGWTYEAGGVSNTWAAGIKAVGKVSNITIEKCLVRYAGYKDAGTTRVLAGPNKGFGIWLDGPSDQPTGCIVRWNLCYSNADSGLFCEKCYSNAFYANVSRNNGQYGLRVDADENGPAVHDNVFYNNTLYANTTAGIYIAGGYANTQKNCYNNAFVNNIASGNGTELIAKWGGENDGTYGSGNTFQYNCFGTEASNFIMWGNAVYKSTYDAWELSYGGSTLSIESDPTFVSAPTNLVQSPGSSCLGVGYSLGTIYELCLDPTSVWPSAVVTVQQIAPWDLGAFVS